MKSRRLIRMMGVGREGIRQIEQKI